MVALEVLIDASRSSQGAAQANAALKSVADQAKSTEDSTKRVGASLSNAFQATNGSLQVAQGVQSIATAFQQANFAAAGGGISRTLLEIARTGADFRQLATGIGASTTAFGAMRAILVAHPLLTIATLIGAAASVLGVFSDNTRRATSEMAAAKTQADGLASALSSVAGSRNTTAPGSDPSVAILNRLRGERLNSALQFREPLQVSGGGADSEYVSLSALESLLPGIGSAYTSGGISGRSQFFSGARGGFAGTPSDMPLVGRSELLRYLEDRERRTTTAAPPDFSGGAPISSFYSPSARGKIEAASAVNLVEQQRERAREAIEQFQEMQREAQRVGEYLGDGIADAVLQARSLKDVVASIGQDIARTLIRQQVGNLASGLAGAFGKTAAQGDPAPLAPNE